MLNSEKYAMADMLIISDFIFDPPNDRVSQFMQEERQKGTRFYGLQIGRDSHQPGFPSPNIALKILNDIRNELLVKLSEQQKLFDYYRNLFLSDDDIKIVKQYLSQCEKSLKEMEVKAQNASLLL